MTSTKQARFGTRGTAWALFALLATAVGGEAHAEKALWLRAAAISPDGRTVAFSYRGDLWTVPATGGAATPLTVHAAYDTAPVWSPDGRQIAFASDRYGNFDVFVMPAAGGEARRLTFHSADDTPTSFTPDGKGVLFSSARLDASTQRAVPHRRPARALPRRPRRRHAGAGAQHAGPLRRLGQGRRAARLLRPEGLRDGVAQARQLLLRPRRLGLGRAPRTRTAASPPPASTTASRCGRPDERALYYLSEKSGSFNVWRLDLADPQHPVQVTTHTVHPVRFLSVSAAGDLCYTFDGEIWVRPAGAAESRKLEVTAAADRRDLRRRADRRRRARSTSSTLSPERQGGRLRRPRRGLRRVGRARHDAPHHRHAGPGALGELLARRQEPALRRRARRELERLPHRPHRPARSRPSSTPPALKETAVLATAAEEFQPRFSPGRQGGRLPRGAHHAQGAEPRERQEPHRPSRRHELLLRRRRPVVRVVARRTDGSPSSSSARPAGRARSAWCRPPAGPAVTT